MQLKTDQICAHRGASGNAPENTMAAFRGACAMAIGSIEFDISLLGDGNLIVHHDGVLGRTIRATGKLAEMSVDAFRTLDAGSWFDDRFAEERAPQLDTVLQLLALHNKFAVLDVKIHDLEHDDFAAALAPVLDRSENNPVPPLVTSFSRPFLTSLRKVAPSARLGLLDEALPADWQSFCDDLVIEAVHLDYRQCDAADIRAVKATGRDVRLYTANDPDAVKPHIEAGVTAIISDFPERFMDAKG